MKRRTFFGLAAVAGATPIWARESAQVEASAKGSTGAAGAAVDPPIQVIPEWVPGSLDPSRNMQWAQDPGLRLERVPIAPVYAALITRGAPDSPSDYENYQVLSSLSIRDLPADEIHIAQGPERPNVTLFLDFGRTLPGYLEFDAEPLLDTTVTVQFGEAMQPTRTYNVKPVSAGSNRFRTDIPHGQWGSLRFAWINLPNLKAPITVRNVRAIYQVFPANYIGNFQSSSPTLDYIWEMCAYSAHAVMAQPEENDPQARGDLQTLAVDRVDRFPWAGDSRVIQTAVEYCFGQYELLRTALERQLPTGKRPIPDLQGIPGYSLDWALAVLDYHEVSGDTPYLKSRLADIDAYIRKYQSGPTPGSWLFFDWDPRILDPMQDAISKQPEPLRLQAQMAFTGKYVQLCRAASRAARSIGKGKLAGEWADIATNTSKEWKRTHPDWQHQCGIHAITNLLLGGVLDPKDWEDAWSAVYADRRRRWTNTPYFGVYVLQALALMGRHDAAVEMLCDYWGSMINAGATTTWEEWSPTTRLPRNAQPPQLGPPSTFGGLSLIQPSGAGPAHWLLAELAGIKPRTPGFKTVELRIALGSLAELNATVASPLGPISVKRRENKGVQVEIVYDVPQRCDAVLLLLPRAQKYELDGKTFRAREGATGELTAEAPSGRHRCLITI